MPVRTAKEKRHELLTQKLTISPFMTDEDLAAALGVSVQTIRLDRLALGIPELRQRIKEMAQQARERLRAIASGEIIGELVDLVPGKTALSQMEITPEMVFSKTGIARGQHMFGQANSLALAVIDAPVAVTGVANIKYKVPVHRGDPLIAQAEVVRRRGHHYSVRVRTSNNTQDASRATFIMVALAPTAAGKGDA